MYKTRATENTSLFTDKRLVVLAQNYMYNIPCKKNEEMMKELTRILSLPPKFEETVSISSCL
jgi:hypothetical protein